jgi:hypothetical protein
VVNVFQPSAGGVAVPVVGAAVGVASEAVGDAVAVVVAVPVAVAVPAGEPVAGAEPGEPQEASVIARHTAEIAVSVDAVRRIKPSLKRCEKTVD